LCREALLLTEEVGGALIAELSPAPLADDALDHVLARLDAPAAPAFPVEAPRTTLAALATGRWWWIAPGIRLMPLAGRDETDTRLDLIRVAPGMKMPQHDHSGPEIACILQGAYGDETGEYRVGDVAEGEPGLDHAPQALAGEDCICLIATTGRLRAHTLVARTMQRLLGI
jgi:putative transcriptional regulator